MNIHEYQAKEIFRRYNVPTPRGYVASSVEEAVQNAQKLGGTLWVVKAQIHAGGRGLGGGVKLARSLDEVKAHAQALLGMNLVTHQTTALGTCVQKIYIEEGVEIANEFYLGMVLDRSQELPVMMASCEGGMEIETIAQSAPEKIIKVSIDPFIGFQSYHGRELAFGLNLPQEETQNFIHCAKALYEAYMHNDASMIEINPLVKTKNGTFIALDAKMSFDDNALFRHPEIVAMRDTSEENPIEREASEYGLSYVKLNGSVGCMVNGAGLAMGTMDIIDYAGGEPANFLDVGGGANANTVAKGFEIILKDPNVKSIFVNIFGGIVRCDRIANGILEATKMVKVDVPVIVRLDGTNAKEAVEILKNANIKNIISATDLSDGAQKAVAAAKGALV
ncbi:ADP-forming succinate--CoA ligase subunit beta [Sulfurospirillum barnesii]|uniref:Succinate--CoA ligase [ADP-forming] subunit beta n=1 Tax=Sulfurospirillum barnesii (strain ATCC 700032 / DSM 10660 / SES-3) TaxID=760154 RepID=I3XWY7_SULBS|nr:ADP-forming succinate--CoA ligase subunit beta [Sulfurospirillum barnesii]AFL68461.1 succinyl-CoA synthetase, beta subunit [Sulfurospirillum barnesii SES-3]